MGLKVKKRGVKIKNLVTKNYVTKFFYLISIYYLNTAFIIKAIPTPKIRKNKPIPTAVESEVVRYSAKKSLY